MFRLAESLLVYYSGFELTAPYYWAWRIAHRFAFVQGFALFKIFLMNKPNRFNPAKKGRQKHKKTHLRTGKPARPQRPVQPIGIVEAKAFTAPASQAPVQRTQGDPLKDEGKRKLWDQKQAMLEARWLEAQERQKEERIVHRRKLRIAYSVTGIASILLLGVIAWNYA
jgi:hypothetical protein